MVVIVNSRHFKDNTYHHSSQRMCPLNEAINEQFKDAHYFVADEYVLRKIDEKNWNRLVIPKNIWNSKIVNTYITAANKGEQFDIEIILSPEALPSVAQ